MTTPAAAFQAGAELNGADLRARDFTSADLGERNGWR
jgi:hypothetical protein